MSKVISAAPIALLTFVAALAVQVFVMRGGFIADDTVSLWAGAIAAGDGEVPLGRVVAAYPTIPFLATTLLSMATPAGAPTPALFAAALLATLAGMWFVAFRAVGLSGIVAASVALLLVFHPALLRAAIGGPADMWLALFVFMLAKGLYDLRARSSAPEVMTVALALLGLAFSHPMGAAIAGAAVPFLVLAVRPALVANSALNVVVALVFPTVFSIGAFTYVSWVFPGSGWSVFASPAATLAAWAAEVNRVLGFTGVLTVDTGLAVTMALVFGAPAAFFAMALVYRRRPLVAPAVILVVATIAAAMLTVATGAFGEPDAVLVMAPILCAVVLIAVPPARERLPIYLMLLVVGWFGGAAGLALVDPRVVAHLRHAVDAPGENERIDALNLGHATLDRDGVLVDTSNSPAVVVGRGQARGLYAPAGDEFALTMVLARLDAPFVAVPDPQNGAGAQDQLNKLFPHLYRVGAPGYRLIYQNNTWRMFARIEQQQVSKD